MNRINHQISYLKLNVDLEEEFTEEDLTEEQPFARDPEEELNQAFFSSCCQSSVVQQDDIYYCSECGEWLDADLDLIDQSDDERFLSSDYDDFTDSMLSDLEDFN